MRPRTGDTETPRGTAGVITKDLEWEQDVMNTQCDPHDAPRSDGPVDLGHASAFPRITKAETFDCGVGFAFPEWEPAAIQRVGGAPDTQDQRRPFDMSSITYLGEHVPGGGDRCYKEMGQPTRRDFLVEAAQIARNGFE